MGVAVWSLYHNNMGRGARSADGRLSPLSGVTTDRAARRTSSSGPFFSF